MSKHFRFHNFKIIPNQLTSTIISIIFNFDFFPSGCSLLLPIPRSEPGTAEGDVQEQPDRLRHGLHTQDPSGKTLRRSLLHGKHRRIQVGYLISIFELNLIRMICSNLPNYSYDRIYEKCFFLVQNC